MSIHPSYPPLPSSSGPLTYSALLCYFTLPPLPSADTQSRIPSCNHHTRHQHLLLYRPGNLGQSQPTLLSSCSSPPIRVPPPYSAPEPSPRDMPFAYSLGTLSVNARVLRSTCAWDMPWSWATGFASPTVSRFPMTAQVCKKPLANRALLCKHLFASIAVKANGRGHKKCFWRVL